MAPYHFGCGDNVDAVRIGGERKVMEQLHAVDAAAAVDAVNAVDAPLGRLR